MMIVITLTSCPAKLRGDLTKWLFEIDTGVYVGNLNARVRDGLWERICKNIGSGRAVMAFSAKNEQQLDFRIWGGDWEPVDLDGIKFVKRIFHGESDRKYKAGSDAVITHKIRAEQRNRTGDDISDYTVIDIETTGLKSEDRIIEIGAVRIRNCKITDSLDILINDNSTVPDEIVKLTGITAEMLRNEGTDPNRAIEQLIEFCGTDILVGHNISFDMGFLRRLCAETGKGTIKNRLADTMKIARRKIRPDGGYSLTTICKHLGLETNVQHRALEDCKLTYRIFEKLKEI